MQPTLSDQELVRRAKLESLRTAGIQPYPERFSATHELSQAKGLPDGTAGVRVAGRIVAIRKMGKLSFLRIQDVEAHFQLCVKADGLGAEEYERFHSLVDIGDYIGAEGDTFTTKTQEKTLQTKKWTFLGKCLRPLPEKWHGLVDVEARYRQRYLDLIMNEETRKRFLLRTAIVREMRAFLESQGFMEVETATLQSNPSGALARPFVTHHNALDIDMFLRIAPETYLKRLIVGGFNRVFEFARCFRNEGISPTHLQEFTMVEGYAAYWNYEDSMRLMRDLFIHIVRAATGTTVLKLGEKEIDLARDWHTASFKDLILRDSGIDIDRFETAEALLREVRAQHIHFDEDPKEVEKLGRANLIDHLYKKVSRPRIVEPTFLVAHPIELSPLARANDANPKLTDRFQLVVNGVEIVNAYSELVDPIEQKKRLDVQAQAHAAGDQDAMTSDDDYVHCMEYGMPPISGWGIGIERLMQFLTQVENVKDCVLFPIVRKSVGQKKED